MALGVTFLENEDVVTTEWRDQKISSRPIPRLFSRPKFLRPRLRLFFGPNIFETDTKTFFQDQMFSRLIPRLFFETKCFWNRYWDFFLRLNVFETDTETFAKLKSKMAVWFAAVPPAKLFINLVLAIHIFEVILVLGVIFCPFLPNFQTFRLQGDKSFAFSSEFSCH